MKTRHLRPGFTLIELLVTIAVIGILVALLVPAVQAAREASRRMSCSNNMRQVALGIHNYHAAFQRFPPGSYHHQPNAYSWGMISFILPYLEQGAKFESIDFGQAHCGDYIIGLQSTGQSDPSSTPIASILCPSDPRAGRSILSGPTGPLPWSGDCGVLHPGNYLGMAGTNDPNITATFLGCGGILDGDGMLYSLSPTRFGSVLDGASTTIMFGERVIPRDLGWGWPICGGHECEHYLTSTLGIFFGNHQPDEYFLHLQHYWSYHPGGCHLVMADGSCKFASYSIDHTTYTDLSTRDGFEVIDVDF